MNQTPESKKMTRTATIVGNRGTARRLRSHRRSLVVSPRSQSARGIGQDTIVPSGNVSFVYQAAKRAFDLAGAVVLVVLLSPIMLLTWLALMVTTKGQPIFAQERLGLCGRRFRMFKFRTMVVDAGKLQHLVVNEASGPVFKNRRDPRITKVGGFLRSTSIDELPQLFNVIMGQMALVGPRPPVPAEVAKYQPWQLQRLAVKPGLTCLWQVSGRCEIGFDDWVRMDIWYLRNQNLQTDLRLLCKTPLSVLSRRGAY
ncbi:MAG TPA: sugar transferase [Pirellulales bacterium]|nr:sugar transferase [Pirellulales bacterium]